MKLFYLQQVCLADSSSQAWSLTGDPLEPRSWFAHVHQAAMGKFYPAQAELAKTPDKIQRHLPLWLFVFQYTTVHTKYLRR